MYNFLCYVDFHGNRMHIHHIYFDQCEEPRYRYRGAANKVDTLSEESVSLLRLRCLYVRHGESTVDWSRGEAKNWDRSVSLAKSERSDSYPYSWLTASFV